MRQTGMKRALDRLGRIVLPKEMRDTMEIHIGDPLEFFVEDNHLILRKYKSTLCVFCSAIDTHIYYKEQFICEQCALQIKNEQSYPELFIQEKKNPDAPVSQIQRTLIEKKHRFYVQKRTIGHENYPPSLRPKTAQMLQQMKELIKQHPRMAQQQLAHQLGVSQGRVSQLKKLL